jgi:hypothetical protein
VATKRSDAPKRKPGRPPRADRAEIEAKVLAAIRVGLSLNKACMACGVPYSTVQTWIAEGGDDFSARAKAAIAERELLWLNEVRREERGWQRIAWLLERTCPQDYGRKDSVKAEVTGAGGGPIVIEVAENATEAEIAAAIRKAEESSSG